ncbi:MAG: ATP synthase subunit c [Alphaproteobacteria bacterium ADurb.Bin438]|nr:MAG: ATP synthase subunit c [Alphaproteobacteria bacterium ADurb.Bin438]
MDNIGLVGAASVLAAGLAIGIGGIGSGVGEGHAANAALKAIAQQPDEAGNITKTLFVCMAMIESTAIYAFVITMIILFANPFWDHVINLAGK